MGADNLKAELNCGKTFSGATAVAITPEHQLRRQQGKPSPSA